MRPLAWLVSLCVPAVFAAFACGGNVVVDHNTGGAGGATGPGPSGPGPSGPGPSGPGPSGPGPGTSVTTTSVGPSTTVTTSTGPFLCDNTGDCSYCQECALNGPCLGLWDACMSDASCTALLDCFSSCMNDQCYQICWDTYPEAQDIYLKLVTCVICEYCYNDCDGASGC